MSGYLVVAGLGTRKAEEKLDVRIFTPSPGDSLRLKKFDFEIKNRSHDYIDASITESELLRMRSNGFNVALVSTPKRNGMLPQAYKTVDEIKNDLTALQTKYPEIVSVEKIGESTTLNLPIWAIKISDNARSREDEPSILFAGVHHAREPIGANICFRIMNALCEQYNKNADITTWVNEIEIWFVPVVNPDGYKYVLENNLGFPWWRKNLRDNDGDGVFNPLVDGVDLNRNYGYNWEEGGDGKPGSWFYRGKMPFSENETRALMNLAMRENFVFGVSYHSYGESILFPWGNYKRPPDLDLIVEIASEMAAHIRRESGRGRYSILPLNGRVGQSSIWMYGQLRIIDFIVEVGNEYFPADEGIPNILQENLNGAFYLLKRALETGVRGHVVDDHTHKPLLAKVEILELSSDHVQPRRTDPVFGRFFRILTPGLYTVEISSAGYGTKIINDVRVQKGKFVDLEVSLQQESRSLSNGTSK
jgi:hypothetical protein